VRQVMARFDQDAVRLGDARAPAPLQVRCNPAAAGNGRWLNTREWVFQFHHDLPGGTRCTVRPTPDFVSAQGEHLEAEPHYSFDTGGPALVTARPSTGSDIDAAQYFILQLRAVPDPQSLADHAWCTVEGLGERVPVRRIGGAQRDQALRTVDWEKAAVQAPGRFEVLQCARTLPEKARVELVWGAGMATSSGLSTAKEKRLGYRVRPVFAAEFTCARENAHAACVPNRPLVLHFNAEVSGGLAKRIILEGPSGRIPPRLGKPGEDNDDAQADSVRTVYFPVSLPELKRFRIVLPPRFADVDGRTLRNAAKFPLTVRTAANPPLIKFATAPFGTIGHYPEGIGQRPALLPVVLRNVESVLGASTLPIGQVRDLRSDSDAEIIRWYGLVHEFDQFWVRRSFAQKVLLDPLPPVIKAASGKEDSDVLAQRSKDAVESRTVSLLDDIPTEISSAAGLYIPENYDHRFRGWISVRTALAASLNIPAVRTLVMLGPDYFAESLDRIGIHLARPAAITATASPWAAPRSRCWSSPTPIVPWPMAAAPVPCAYTPMIRARRRCRCWTRARPGSWETSSRIPLPAPPPSAPPASSPPPFGPPSRPAPAKTCVTTGRWAGRSATPWASGWVMPTARPCVMSVLSAAPPRCGLPSWAPSMPNRAVSSPRHP